MVGVYRNVLLTEHAAVKSSVLLQCDKIYRRWFTDETFNVNYIKGIQNEYEHLQYIL